MSDRLQVHIFNGRFPTGLKTKNGYVYANAQPYWGQVVTSKKDRTNEKYAFFFRADGTMIHVLTKESYNAWIDQRGLHGVEKHHYPANLCSTSEYNRMLDTIRSKGFSAPQVKEIIETLVGKGNWTVDVVIRSLEDKHLI